MNPGTASPEVLQRSQRLSTFAHQGAVYLYHDLYGYLLQMSPDLLAFLDQFAEPRTVAEVVAAHADAFEGQSPQQFVDVFYQHACLVEPGDDERFAHYVRKEKILESALTGEPVIALCGKVWLPNRDPQKFPVCPACKEILDSADGPEGDGGQ